MKKVPFVDLERQYLTIKSEIDEAISSVIARTDFISGSSVTEFEKSFAENYGIKHCISVGNGTDSLFIIMKMLGIGPGDEVITTAHSWISTSETISLTGAKVVFCDVDDYYTINVDQINRLITEKTKAIIPVHLAGQACDMDAIMKIGQDNNLHIIEDCAQAHFSEFKGRRVGTFGIAGSFSFYPGKNLGAYGDAGCIITNNDELANQFRMFSRHGALKKHDHKIEGINSRMDGLQAAILLVKLKYIHEWTRKRIDAATLYDHYLKKIENIELPKRREGCIHSHHLYIVKAQNRDNLIEYLLKKGIQTAIHYPSALPNLEAYNYLQTPKSDYLKAQKNSFEILSLPIFPEITEEEILFVSQAIAEFYN